jgi:calcineurin-like phosphoesterase family protein
MSKVYFLSDLHLDHKNILDFSGPLRGGNTVEEHDDWIISQINSVVKKRDTLYLLGDVAMSQKGLNRILEIPCKKHLIMGNHDTEPMLDYLRVFDTVRAYTKYKGFWISHMPVSNFDFDYRVRGNVHGHTHFKTVSYEHDPKHWWRYINVSVERSYGLPVTFESLFARFEQMGKAHGET